MSLCHLKMPRKWRNNWLCRFMRKRRVCLCRRSIEKRLSSIVAWLLRHKLKLAFLYVLACLCLLWSVLFPEAQPLVTPGTTTSQAPPLQREADSKYSILVDMLTFGVAVVGLYLLNLRLKKQDKQIEMQVQKEIDDRFHSAVSLLGNSETSARMGAIYSLYYLAIDNKKYRSQVAEILCAHISSITGDQNYQKNHQREPSFEVQTAIDLLFKQPYTEVLEAFDVFFKNTKKVRGLYSLFHGELPRGNLFRAYLVGVDFTYANCQKVNFWRSNCVGALFLKANCQGANFDHSWCLGTFFMHACCQGASFSNAMIQGAVFTDAHCQGVNFMGTRCQGTDFRRAEFQGAYALSHLDATSLSQRINKDTELKTMIISGGFNPEEKAVMAQAGQFFPEDWNKRMQSIMAANENVPDTPGIPDGIITGILEDTPEIRQIAKEIEG